MPRMKTIALQRPCSACRASGVRSRWSFTSTARCRVPTKTACASASRARSSRRATSATGDATTIRERPRNCWNALPAAAPPPCSPSPLPATSRNSASPTPASTSQPSDSPSTIPSSGKTSNFNSNTLLHRHTISQLMQRDNNLIFLNLLLHFRVLKIPLSLFMQIKTAKHK